MIANGSMIALAQLMVCLIGLGVFVGSRRAGSEVARARRTALLGVFAVELWLAFAAFLGQSGVLSNWTALPPRWPLLPVAAFVAIALVMRTAAVTRIITFIPAAWPIAIQGFRIGVELTLHALYAAGRAPIQITFEGRNFDILIGLSAPLVAALVARKRIGARGAIAWNVVGLAVLANTVVTVATSTPGPLHHDWGGAPLTVLTQWPVVWLPAFLMPVAVLLHVVSLRQNLRTARHAAD